MNNMKDLTNIAYSNDFIEHKNKIINFAYNPNNKIKDKEVIDGNLRRIITEYRTEYNGKKYFCSNNRVYEGDKFIFEYFNLYHHPFFCEKITYTNGHEYIFYKAGLYGYRAFDIDTKNTFNYYPKCSFVGNFAETFIGTDIHFNNKNNTFAVGGCYWACPTDVFLLKIDNPLEQYERYVNLHLIIDKDYDKYEDIDFIEWENNDIKIKCYNVETEPSKNEIIIIKENEYMEKMVK